MVKKKRHMAPSRRRYEASHPVVSVRVSQELKAELESQGAKGRSLGDILRIGLSRQTAADRLTDRARQEAHSQGYEEARARFAVAFACSVCRELVEITDEQAKAVAAAALEQARWGHSACIGRQRNR